jgi:hypothetical protein
MKLRLVMQGPYRELVLAWWTCARGDGSEGYIPAAWNSLSADWPSGITTAATGGPYLTHAKLRFLSCDNGIYTKHIITGGPGFGGAYTWENSAWVFNPQ